MADDREMLLVQSKVREAIKAKGGAGDEAVRTSEEFLTALNEFVHETLQKAIERARANKRATLKPQDL
ncbi:hypothetical protein [Vulgatibacter sp.]|uniref:hypothetical protein n=1 Tax=Vulgatibacter sp. TaxID=1971226 RepID=UPI003563BA4D